MLLGTSRGRIVELDDREPGDDARMTTIAQPRAQAPSASKPRTADVLVIFGITGDLAKVMTFLSLYRLERRGLLDCPIVGVAGDDWTDADLRERARTSIETAGGEPVDDTVFDRLAARLSYVAGDFGEPGTYARLARELGPVRSPVFYLEVPPALFGMVIKGLADADLTESARVVVEKPFGHDLDSARTLADEIHRCLGDSQLSRLALSPGKMGLAGILSLRFANPPFEAGGSRHSVPAVQIPTA